VKPAVVAGYLLLTVALAAMWEQDSVPGIGAVAVLVLGLTALQSGQFTRFKAGGANINVEIEKVLERVEEAATVAATAGNVGGGPSEIEYRTRGPQHKARGGPDWELVQSAETARRLAIERLMKDSAVWGWLMARIGFQTPPEPEIEWTRDGHARITYGKGQADPKLLEALARRLERLQKQPNDDEADTQR
jgi:hypothetical protein